ncbi:hypothetical protein AKJ36_02335 [candidate division MSBL1 archaeon SCGC-AAA259I07]|uniref:Uncharacterized protein n=1 Tax=candidate division MSBL1 archaeon SCGC-AAA259I07 TaxID=1698266 RepID=A0A133UKH4_9EURY|nr:hypothetical protein AKJ36_02335 [candidate division MSBL1 archaeon SCGC-AAA259I07]
MPVGLRKDSDGYVPRTEEDYERRSDISGGPYKKECAFCGEMFYAYYPTRKYCSYRCKNDAYIERRRQRKKEARKKTCQYCGEEFQAGRVDAKYCSSKCRVYAWRNDVGGE